MSCLFYVSSGSDLPRECLLDINIVIIGCKTTANTVGDILKK